MLACRCLRRPHARSQGLRRGRYLLVGATLDRDAPHEPLLVRRVKVRGRVQGVAVVPWGLRQCQRHVRPPTKARQSMCCRRVGLLKRLSCQPRAGWAHRRWVGRRLHTMQSPGCHRCLYVKRGEVTWATRDCSSAPVSVSVPMSARTEPGPWHRYPYRHRKT